METLVEDATGRGGRIVTGGARRGNAGFFFDPTVVVDPDRGSAVMNEEPFGPVSVVMPARDEQAALDEANRLRFGLAAYAFTRSADIAHTVSETVEAGMIGINTFNVITPESPVGGVKDSGYGVESGSEGVASFLQPRHVAQLSE
jgi:succinate-semialdehyde dehydrogenase/glutarate-semialdehyde dehydrogenase